MTDLCCRHFRWCNFPHSILRIHDCIHHKKGNMSFVLLQTRQRDPVQHGWASLARAAQKYWDKREKKKEDNKYTEEQCLFLDYCFRFCYYGIHCSKIHAKKKKNDLMSTTTSDFITATKSRWKAQQLAIALRQGHNLTELRHPTSHPHRQDQTTTTTYLGCSIQRLVRTLLEQVVLCERQQLRLLYYLGVVDARRDDFAPNFVGWWFETLALRLRHCPASADARVALVACVCVRVAKKG